MNKWLLQHTSPETEEIRAVVEPINAEFAGRHGFTYIMDNQQTFPPFAGLGTADPNWVVSRETLQPSNTFNPYWEKFRIIRQCMERAEDGDFIEYADIDAIHTGQAQDTSELLFGCDMSIRLDPRLPVNAGVIFFRVNELTKTLIDRCLAHGPVSDEEWAGRGVCAFEERRLHLEMQALMADPSDPESYGLRVFPMDALTHSYHPTQREVIFHAGNRTTPDKLILLRMAAGMIRR